MGIVLKCIYMHKCKHTSIHLPESLHVDLKIFCVLTNRTMSDFIRISIQDKIKQVKEEQIDKKKVL